MPGAQASLPATDVASTSVADLRCLDFEFVTPLRQRRCRQGCLRSRQKRLSVFWLEKPRSHLQYRNSHGRSQTLTIPLTVI